MKSYTQYLQESKKTWKFKIKTIHELTDDQSDRIEKHLLKYDSNGLGAVKKTMLQSAPKDFPMHRGYEVFTYEFETKLSATAEQIYNEIRNMLGLNNSSFKIKSDQDLDLDEEAEVKEPKAVDSKELYGDDFNSNFIKELLALRKEKEKGNE
jgi:hypothetical protein